MEHKELEPEADEPQQAQSSYTLISYKSDKLPANYTNMILSKWLRSLKFGNDYFRLIDKDAYFNIYDLYIKQILAKPDTTIKLAVLSDDFDVVLGFSIIRGTVLDYVHVHKDYRKQGIGTVLVPQGITTITHLTKPGMSIWAAKMPNVKFNPFI